MKFLAKIGKTNLGSFCLPLLLVASFFSRAGSQPSKQDTARVRDPDQDFVFLELEPFPRFQGEATPKGKGPWAWRIAGQLAFPAGSIAGHDLFGVFKSTLLDRNIVHGDSVLNAGPMQRYWLSGGVSVVDRPKQNSSLIVGAGLNSDMADLGRKDFNTEYIYSHNFVLSPDFTWGLGLDVQRYFGEFQPYPLIFIDWRIDEKTKLKWDADYVELHRYLGSFMTVTAGLRFNLEFFALKHDASYEFNSMGLEGGIQYSLGANCYIRMKYKELVWGNEYFGMPSGRVYKESIAGGRSLRLNFAYGI